ncbi:MAG: hypothetical protein K2Q25_08085 [Mycobacteriaceae bacterium]|nr:hypothetical protein [Mycobacteriaceae bacterium]
MTFTKYRDLYSYKTRSGASLGTALFVVDVFTLIASTVSVIETFMLDDYRLNSGKSDIAANVAQLIFYIYRFNVSNVLADVQIRILIVLKLAQDIIVVLEQMNGFGLPSNGDKIIDSASMLDDVVVASTVVDSGKWSGCAVGKYGTRTGEQQKSAESVADADRELAKIVHRQAGEVEQGRQAFASIRLGLYQAMPLAFAYGMCVGAFANPKMIVTDSSHEIPDPADPLARMEKYVYTVVGLAGVAALATIGSLIGCGSANAEDMKSPIDTYRRVAN